MTLHSLPPTEKNITWNLSKDGLNGFLPFEKIKLIFWKKKICYNLVFQKGWTKGFTCHCPFSLGREGRWIKPFSYEGNYWEAQSQEVIGVLGEWRLRGWTWRHGTWAVNENLGCPVWLPLGWDWQPTLLLSRHPSSALGSTSACIHITTSWFS